MPIAYDARWRPRDHSIRRNITRHQRARSNHGPRGDYDAFHYHRFTTDPNVMTNLNRLAEGRIVQLCSGKLERMRANPIEWMTGPLLPDHNGVTDRAESPDPRNIQQLGSTANITHRADM